MKLNNRGFTLIELLVVTAIMGIVISLAFSLYFFGSNTFKKSGEQYQLQSDLRLSTDFIVKEVRNATELNIIEISDIPNPVPYGYHYLYIEGKKLMYSTNGTLTSKTEAVIQDDQVFSIEKLNSGKNLLAITLKGQKNNQNYEVSTEVLLNNLHDLNSEKGKVIRYKKP